MQRLVLFTMLLSAAGAHAGKAAKLGEEFVLQLDETATLPGGATLKFVSLSVEEIAASPDDPVSYPAGSGVNVSLEFKNGTAPAERIELNQLSAGYTSKSSASSQGYHFVLVKTADEHARAKATLRVLRVLSDAERANIKKVAAQRGAPLAFVIRIVSIHALFPIRDMPNGYGTWELTTEVLEVVSGTLSDAKASPFQTNVELWMGPVLSRPMALWVNEQPATDSVWVVLASSTPASAAKLLSGRGDGVRVAFEKDKLAQFLTR